jgi:hypothetical protein
VAAHVPDDDGRADRIRGGVRCLTLVENHVAPADRNRYSLISAASIRSLSFRPFSFLHSPPFPPKLLRKACGKKRAQSDVQNVRKSRGKSAESLADILRVCGE